MAGDERPAWACLLHLERTLRDWSQARLAAELERHAAKAKRTLPDRGNLIRMIRSWEAGKHRPDPFHCCLLAQAFETTEDRLFDSEAAALRLLEMNRREAIKKGVAALGLGGLALNSFIRDTAVESSELALEAEELSLDPPTLERLRLQVVQFGLDYLHTPPKHLYLDVFAVRREVKDLLRYKPNQAERTELFALIGWLSGLLGHLAMDLGYHSAAQTHCEGGLRVAQVIGHHDAIAWIRGTQAMMATYTDRADEGVRYAQMGQRFARAGSTASIRLAAQEMRACARLGDRRSAENAMQRAQEAMAALTEEPTRSIFSFDRPYLPFYAGTSYVWLENAGNAQNWSQEAIRLCDAEPADWPVARALARIDLATSFAWQREIEEACRIGAEAAEIASKRRVNLVARRSNDLRRALAPHHALPVVQSFREQLATL
jgi:transcriptional regulator with XRE-family HTH domain